MLGPQSSDEDLMLAYGAGDAGAFDTLYARHKGGVYRYILRQCRNAGIADELFQDVWMSAIRVRASYAPTARFTTWIYTLAHNRIVDHWRATSYGVFGAAYASAQACCAARTRLT
jgi:RNA polymerase sigma-70 factor (ECF subfamily)